MSTMLINMYSSNYVRPIVYPVGVKQNPIGEHYAGGCDITSRRQTLSNGTYSKAYVAFYAGTTKRSSRVHVT